MRRSIVRPLAAASVVRVVQDGPFVVTHSDGELFGSKVFFDSFRFRDGRIVEHREHTVPVEVTTRSAR